MNNVDINDLRRISSENKKETHNMTNEEQYYYYFRYMIMDSAKSGQNTCYIDTCLVYDKNGVIPYVNLEIELVLISKSLTDVLKLAKLYAKENGLVFTYRSGKIDVQNYILEPSYLIFSW